MTPGQLAIVERTLATLDLAQLGTECYRRAFAAEPDLAAMFPTDPGAQRARFAAELDALVRSIRSLDRFARAAGELGARHQEYGVRSAHYRVMGTALLGALAAALGDDWTTDVEEAWTMAYNLVAETMLLGAAEARGQDR
jgi:hemoglobin-like flavoprotein